MQREPTAPHAAEVAMHLAENYDLLEAAHERLCLGRLHESLQYQTQLQQNLIYLATHADDDPNLKPLRFLSAAAQEQHENQTEEQVEGRPRAQTEQQPDSQRDQAAEDDQYIENMVQRRLRRRVQGGEPSD